MTNNDETFFEQHPERSIRIRPALYSDVEFGSGITHVIVTHLGPGLRTRRGVKLTDPELKNIVASLAAEHFGGDWTEGHICSLLRRGILR